MNSLGCFKDKDKLKQDLLKAEHNTGEINTILCDFNDLSLFRKSDIFPAS